MTQVVNRLHEADSKSRLPTHMSFGQNWRLNVRKILTTLPILTRLIAPALGSGRGGLKAITPSCRGYLKGDTRLRT